MEDNLFDLQERLISFCKDEFNPFYLYNKTDYFILDNEIRCDYKTTVCTIYDYLPENKTSEFSEHPYADSLYKFVVTLAPIRIYVIGNEESIPDSMCKYFFDKEVHDSTEIDYDKKCTFIRHEPIGLRIQEQLGRILNVSSSWINAGIKELHQLRADSILFRKALDRVNDNLPAYVSEARRNCEIDSAVVTDETIEISAQVYIQDLAVIFQCILFYF